MKTGTIIVISLSGGLVLAAIGASAYKALHKLTNSSSTWAPKPFSILFIGDSNTAANFSYADQLKKQYPNIVIKKIAQSSMKTDWMRQQLNDELKKNKYNAVSILGGSNDIYALGRIDSAMVNLDSMYQMAHAAGAKVIAITPPSHNFYTNATAQKLALQTQLNNWIKQNPNKDYFIDFTDITNNKNFFSQSDGYLHAQAPAHKILAQNVAQQLNLTSKA